MVAVCAGSVVVVLSAFLTVATTCTLVVPVATPRTTALAGVAATGSIVATPVSTLLQVNTVLPLTSTPLLSTASALMVSERPTPTSPEVVLILTLKVSGVVAAGVAGELEPPPPPPQAASKNVMAVPANQVAHVLSLMMFPRVFFPALPA
ncbi:exported hypothetical protein [Cupriavidus oxalaticus]|uniref:Uncharacterized protein n=1 Tax=Cupriavidus oxalaticus TaxID=96344 RepID=A0A375GFY6_9BURK|nr:exported hypothetical protein [Cupriavidus oxalaticus]